MLSADSEPVIALGKFCWLLGAMSRGHSDQTKFVGLGIFFVLFGCCFVVVDAFSFFRGAFLGVCES